MEFLQNVLSVVVTEFCARDWRGIFLVWSNVPVEAWLEVAKNLEPLGKFYCQDVGMCVADLL